MTEATEPTVSNRCAVCSLEFGTDRTISPIDPRTSTTGRTNSHRQVATSTSSARVTLDELVDAPPTGDPRVNMRPLPTRDGTTILPLTRRPGGIQAYKFVLPAGRDDEEPRLRTHEGYDWAFVLNGRLRLVLGPHDLVLEPGEAVEFDTRTPHWFGATSSGPVEFLSLIGKQG